MRRLTVLFATTIAVLTGALAFASNDATTNYTVTPMFTNQSVTTNTLKASVSSTYALTVQ